MSDPHVIGLIECQQDPNDKLEYTVDFEEELGRYREPHTIYALNAQVRSRVAPGLQYKATTAGRTGNAEPKWPTSVGGTVTDGSVVWTAEAIATTSLTSTLSSAAWTYDTGVTVSGQVESGQASQVYISGGTDGQAYTVVCTGTMADGRKMTGVVVLTVKRKAAA